MIVAIIYSIYALIFLTVLVFLLRETFHIVSTPDTKTYKTEEDAWDEIDGGTYVTMHDGTVRLDNNGGR